MSDPHQSERREERGIVMVMVALAMTTLVLFAALAIDVGGIWTTRTESQGTVDGAALAAAEAMIQQSPSSGSTVSKAAARAAAIDVASRNSAIANPKLVLRDSDEDFTFGSWNSSSRTLESAIESDPDQVTGVTVQLVMDGTVNQRSPSFLSGLLGRQGFDVRSTATAYLGFEGDWKQGDFDLPIAIDICNITGKDQCSDDFCSTVEPSSPPTPCPLNDGTGDIVSCLKFPSSMGVGRNACWTSFVPSGGILEGPLMEIVADGSPSPARVGDTIDLSQVVPFGGDVRLIEDIERRFKGLAPYEAQKQGADRHFPTDGESDSWVVKLPVVECQNNHHCEFAGKIMGSVCFEIREVDHTKPSDQWIRGTFLCPKSSDSKVREIYNQFCLAADGSGPGGCNLGMRADRAVLVH